MNHETPLELERRISAQRDYESNERAAREKREREIAERASTRVPPKQIEDMNPVELQNHLAQIKAEADARAAAHAETVMKDRIRRAFINAGGEEAEFEEQYPGLRKRYVAAQTMNALQGGDVPVGSLTADGLIRW
jgi:hypothetical protein